MEIAPVIRRASNPDCPKLFDLVKSVAGETRVDWTSTQVQEELSSPKGRVFVLEGGAKFCGFLFGREILPTEWEIRNLAVSESLRHQGWAKKLINHLFNSIPQRPVRVILEVAQTNTAAIRFYEEMGAKKLYSRKNLYRDEDGWIFAFEVQ